MDNPSPFWFRDGDERGGSEGPEKSMNYGDLSRGGPDLGHRS